MFELSRGALYPVLPLRDIVVFPHMIVPLFVGREKSVRALEDVMKDDKQILLVTQKNAAQDDPTPERHLLRRHGRHRAAAAEAARRHREGAGRGRPARAHRCASPRTTQFFQAYAETDRREAGRRSRSSRRWRAPSVAQFEQYIKLNKKIPPEVLVSINQIEDPAQARRHGRLAPRAQDRREAGAAGDRDASPSGWRRSSASWKARSACSRSRSASAAASSARWRRRSASTI